MEPEVAGCAELVAPWTTGLSALRLRTQPLSGPGCRGNNNPVAAFPRPDSHGPWILQLDSGLVDKLLWGQSQGLPLESTIG